MRKQTILVAGFMVLAAFTGVAGFVAADPCTVGTDCKVQTVAGPATVKHKQLAALGVAFCQDDDASLPLFCDAPQGTLAVAGGAIFDVSNWNGTVGNFNATVWAESAPSNINGPLGTGGFGADVCNDRDFDGTCTNVLANNDQLFDGESNAEIFPTPDCTDAKKGHKDPCDPTDVEVGPYCFGRTFNTGNGSLDGSYLDGQVVVFIYLWVSTNPFANVGAGVSLGSFDVYIERDTNENCGEPSENDIFDDNPLSPFNEPPMCGTTHSNVGGVAGNFNDCAFFAGEQWTNGVGGTGNVTAPAYTRVIAHVQENGCEAHEVWTHADAFGTGTVTTDFWCLTDGQLATFRLDPAAYAGAPLLTSTAAAPGGPQSDTDGPADKTLDLHYVCRVTFTVVAGQFLGHGACLDFDPMH